MKKTVLNSIKIKENFEKFDKIDFGCDYLLLSFVHPIEFFSKLVFNVDTDNSNFGVIELFGKQFTYSSTNTPTGIALKFFIEYNGVPAPIFQYVHYYKSSREMISRSAQVDIYGSYFRLQEIGEFEYRELINYFKSFGEDPIITRFDYRIDYFSKDNLINVPKCDEVLGYIHAQSSKIEWSFGGRLIDRRIGNPDTGRYAIRYYDKKVDTEKKGKWFLYTDFLDYKTVHRLEIQLGRAFCREFQLSQLDDLERKVLQVLGINGEVYSSNCFYQYNSDSEITLDNANNFIKRFYSLSNKLFKAGYSPFLLIEDYIGARYGKDVAKGLIDDFISKSKIYEGKFS